METFIKCPKSGTKIDLDRRIKQLVAERSQTAAAEVIKGMKHKMEEDKKKATEAAAAQARNEALPVRLMERVFKGLAKDVIFLIV